MVIYFVSWEIDKSLSKGKGKTASKEESIKFSVLCRNIADASRCLAWYFEHEFSPQNKHELTLEDGVIRMYRMTVDSRNFTCRYLMMDGIKEPLIMSDIFNCNVSRLNKIFRM